MKNKVLHYSLVIPNEYGGLQTTTLCGRMLNYEDDGYNVADKKEEVSCKHCLKAMETYWGKLLMEKGISYK
ncbi:MAG: hypothetical protein PHS54_05120 [Clostridia bacterium]|nr:hypothetical protein [Clostridia bacterium]